MIPIRSFSRTDVGLKRDNNEDSFVADDESGLYVVADGMGGHAAGEVASKQVVDSVRAGLAESWTRLNELALSGEPEARAELESLMQAAVLRACKDVHDFAKKDPRRHKMGSTCVALLCVNDKAVIGHVGDSRVYLFRAGSLHRLTEDHTLGAEQVRRGFITEEEMVKLPTKNILLRCMGLEPVVAVDTLVTDLYPGDSLLLCSDGLYGDLSDDEVARFLSRQDLSKAAHELVDLANERGGKDNSTGIVLAIGEDDLAHTDVGGKVDVLRTIPLFEQLSYRELLELLSISATRKYDPGATVVREGDKGEEIFAIVRGEVDIMRDGQPIARLKTGGYFGEMVMFDRSPRSATVLSAAATTLIALEREGLVALMKRNAELSNKLLWSFCRILANRLRDTNLSLARSKAELGALKGES